MTEPRKFVRQGVTVTTTLSNREIASRFSETVDSNHWLWFWMVKTLQENESAPAISGALDFISDSFVLAIGRGLVSPSIRLFMKEYNRRYRIYVNDKGTVCVKAGQVHPGTTDPVGDAQYIGCMIYGKWIPSKYPTTPLPADVAFIEEIKKDVVGFFIRASKDMNVCCYCGIPLDDPRSKEAGYGEICAARYGLPWGKVKNGQEFPSFATLWAKAAEDDKRNIRAVCRGIRQEPEDPVNWMALRDILTDAGWPENRLPEKPKKRVTVPRL